jgi:cystathionine beta-lyase/cystathionine gamma-synthase
LHQRLQFLQKTVGAVLFPDERYRAIQDIKTLSLRLNHISESAQNVANGCWAMRRY